MEAIFAKIRKNLISRILGVFQPVFCIELVEGLNGGGPFDG